MSVQTLTYLGVSYSITALKKFFTVIFVVIDVFNSTFRLLDKPSEIIQNVQSYNLVNTCCKVSATDTYH